MQLEVALLAVLIAFPVAVGAVVIGTELITRYEKSLQRKRSDRKRPRTLIPRRGQHRD